MLSYNSVAKVLDEHRNSITGKDKQKVEKFFQAHAEKDCDNMERIVRYWQKSNSPILSLLSFDDSNSIMKSPRRKILYKLFS